MMVYDEKCFNEEVVVLFAASYVEPDTMSHFGGVRDLSNVKADTLLPAVGEKVAPADMRSSTGTANVTPSGPSSKTVLIIDAPVMPPLLKDSASFISAGSWSRRYESTVTVPVKAPAGNCKEREVPRARVEPLTSMVACAVCSATMADLQSKPRKPRLHWQ